MGQQLQGAPSQAVPPHRVAVSHGSRSVWFQGGVTSAERDRRLRGGTVWIAGAEVER